MSELIIYDVCAHCTQRIAYSVGALMWYHTEGWTFIKCGKGYESWAEPMPGIPLPMQRGNIMVEVGRGH
jgi:hypothetical protein